jgi:hypothetical protein
MAHLEPAMEQSVSMLAEGVRSGGKIFTWGKSARWLLYFMAFFMALSPFSLVYPTRRKTPHFRAGI